MPLLLFMPWQVLSMNVLPLPGLKFVHALAFSSHALVLPRPCQAPFAWPVHGVALSWSLLPVPGLASPLLLFPPHALPVLWFLICHVLAYCVVIALRRHLS